MKAGPGRANLGRFFRVVSGVLKVSPNSDTSPS
jgi:hypothetical protein